MINDKNDFNEAELDATADDVQLQCMWGVNLYYLAKNEDKNKPLVTSRIFQSILNGHPILFVGSSESDRTSSVDEYLNTMLEQLKSDDTEINEYKKEVLLQKSLLLSFTLHGAEIGINGANTKTWVNIMNGKKPYNLYMVFYSYPKEIKYHAVLYPEYENAEKLFNSLVRRFGDEKYVKVKYGKEYYQKNENVKDTDFMAVFSYAQANPKKCNFKELLKYINWNKAKLDG